MDRNIVYPGAIPLDTDLLSINRNIMVALGYLARAALGKNTTIDGLTCTPTVPPSMSVVLGPGSITQLAAVDTSPYGSLNADTVDSIMKMGINTASQLFDLQAPATAGMSQCYLIQASLQESDQGLTVLPYYNAATPSQPYSGPTNSGLSQATVRKQMVQLQLKTGAPSTTGTQLAPSADSGAVGLYVVTVAYGQTTIAPANIATLPTAPFLTLKLPDLQPGFGTGVQRIVTNQSFIVPAGITRLEVEVWGGGSGSFASYVTGSTGFASGGGSGGGYARRRIDNLTPGQSIAVTVGAGGTGGTVSGTAAGPGSTSSFGSYVSATGGSLNHLASTTDPQYGATPAGSGNTGDVNFTGSAGQAGILNQGGMGGGAPMGGAQNSGTTGVAGTTPGGGASGAGTGANSATAYDGAAGGPGLVIVRW